ncbi:hypothetical protein [Actibacterium sp. XHP0104]|uniref:hypothetical protein n=1 Tax=Actibacterium sp. XHP0104 TaxID=2984335 RepID=UPI0021E8F4AE|nr:hypothetical protein [Actibacterium sp. XHP0104]MCV2881236.1 hypothetical protein [Actibacterium sp. XHP0104]
MKSQKILNALSHRLHPGRDRRIMVAGTFRSGTNLAHHCLGEFFKTKPVYNTWFWKHGVPPTNLQKPIPEHVPILVMSKDPATLNISLYRFWKARRPELVVDTTLSQFVRRRFVVYDNSRGNIDPKYYYLTPTEYWNQFYFSWLNWEEVKQRCAFLRVEDLMAAPDLELSRIASQLGLERRTDAEVVLPQHRVGPTPPTEIREQDLGLTDDDVAFIRSAVDQSIAAKLGYDYS